MGRGGRKLERRSTLSPPPPACEHSPRGWRGRQEANKSSLLLAPNRAQKPHHNRLAGQRCSERGLLRPPAQPAGFRGERGGSHLALAGLRCAAPHEALVDGPQVLLPVVHLEAAQVRTARRRHHQLRVHGLALRLRPGDHGGQGPAARGGRRGGRGRRQRGAGGLLGGAPRPAGGRAPGTKRGRPRGRRTKTRLRVRQGGGGGQPGAARAALAPFAERGAGRGAEAAGGGYVIPCRPWAPHCAGSGRSRARPATPPPLEPQTAGSGTVRARVDGGAAEPARVRPRASAPVVLSLAVSSGRLAQLPLAKLSATCQSRSPKENGGGWGERRTGGCGMSVRALSRFAPA